MSAARQRLGIAVGTHELRAALVGRSGDASWTGSLPFDGVDALETQLAALLATVAPGSVAGARASVAIGTAWVQVKALVGLPAVSDLATIGSIVRSVPQQFFLRGGSAPVVAKPHRDAAGRVWCAAFEREVLGAVERGCHSAGLALQVVVPTVTAIARRSPDGAVVWRDGGCVVRLAIASRWHAAVVRGRTAAEGPSICEVVEPPFDAVAAATASHRDPLAWRPAADSRERRRRRWRVGALTAALGASGISALLAPTVRVWRASAAAESTGRVPSTTAAAELARTQRELRTVSLELDQIEQFLATRRSSVKLLGAISGALPDSTAMLSFRVDSAGGAITALAPRMTDVVPALVGTEELVAPRLAGSVTRDVMSGALLERATIRFRLPGPTLATPTAAPSRVAAR